jgi:hypothetical protein
VQRAGFDLSDHGELGWKLRQIGGAHGITIARGSGEGRDVAIGGNGLGEDSAGGVEKVYRFGGAWSYLRSVVFDGTAGGFKG